MKDKRREKILTVGLFLTAAVFFCNPTVSLIDVLPDFIGYLFLLAGFDRIRDLGDELEAARIGFAKMVPLDLAKWVVLALLFGWMPLRERTTAVLVAVFSFGVLELWLLIPALSHLNHGLTILGDRFGSESLFGRERERALPETPAMPGEMEAYEKRCARIRRKNETRPCFLDRMYRITLVFVWGKTALTVVPEFAALSESNDGFDWYGYIGIFRILAVAIGMALGLWWLLRMWRFLRRLGRDDAFLTALEAQYRVLEAAHPEKRLERSVKAAMTVLCVGMAFSLDFYIDYYNVIPDVLCAVFILCGLWMARRYVAVKPAMIVTGIFGAVSVLTSVAQVSFLSQYYFSAIFKNDRAYSAFLLSVAGTVAEAALFVATAFMVTRCQREIIDRYTGFDVAGEAQKSHVAHVHKELYRAVYAFLAAAAVSGVTGILYDVTKVRLGFVWMIDFVAAAVCICLFFRAVAQIREQMSYKYLLS